MLPKAQGHRGRVAKGIKQSLRENGEITPIGTYAARGQGSSRASRQMHKTIIS